MKTLVKDSSSAWLFEDHILVEILADSTIVKDGGKIVNVICDCNAQTAVLYENISPPQDWSNNKYLFDGSSWTPNPFWRDPATEHLWREPANLPE